MFKRELMFAVITLAAVFLSLSLFTSDVFAEKPSKGFLTSSDCNREHIDDGAGNITTHESCCWFEYNPETGKDDRKRCQSCEDPARSGDVSQYDCGGISRPLPKGLPQLETVPPNRTLPGGGVGDVPTLEQVPSNMTIPGGGGIPTVEQVPPPARTLPGGGVGGIPTLQQQQGEPPLPVVCSREAGLELDEETGQCVPIERPPPSPPRDEGAQEPPQPEEQSGGEEQPPQQSEDGGGGGGDDSGDGGSGDGDGGNGNNNNDN